ncbi:MAG: hypothetical protein HYV16_09105 [Gammaproteobacteria bacterium]|nr:hypothetical protein [Gammaproteobacteria bacterium]
MDFLRALNIGLFALATAACASKITSLLPPPEPALPEPMVEYRHAPCKPNAKEAALAGLLLKSPLQKRPALRCNGVLETFARQRALDMSQRGYVSHRTPEGLYVNDLLREHYPLPRFYLKRGNQVEAIAAGLTDPDAVWQAWLESHDAHREHVLGDEASYREQDEYGIGYVYNPEGSHGDYWVLILARRAQPDDPHLLCPPPPGACIRLD